MAIHALNARIYMDTTTGGSAAVGTATLTLLSYENSWSVDRGRDFVDGTVFGATSKTGLPGLPNASGDISGFWAGTAGTALYVPGSSTVERGLMIFPDFTNNVGSYYSGKAFFSDKAAGSTTSAISFDFHFEAGPTGLTWT